VTLSTAGTAGVFFDRFGRRVNNLRRGGFLSDGTDGGDVPGVREL
jgi:hypothetical protein